jgi:hypothetical protein
MPDHGHGSRVRLELCSRARSSVKQQRNTTVHISLVNLEDLHRTKRSSPGTPRGRRSAGAGCAGTCIYYLYVMDFPAADVTLLGETRLETGHRLPGTADSPLEGLGS